LRILVLLDELRLDFGEVSQLAKALDQLDEASGLLRGGQVAARKLGGLDRIVEPLPSQAQSTCLAMMRAPSPDFVYFFFFGLRANR
jgi:hypothetical protein